MCNKLFSNKEELVIRDIRAHINVLIASNAKRALSSLGEIASGQKTNINKISDLKLRFENIENEAMNVSKQRIHE